MVEIKRKIKIHLYLARCGYGSRRKAEALVRDGDVRVNGKVAQIGQRVDPMADEVLVGKQKVVSSRAEVAPHMWLFNKPKGVICSASDENGRPTVFDYLKFGKRRGRLFLVGRLDFNTEGLLLVTNDGQLCNTLLSPKFHVRKVYEALIKGDVSDKVVQSFARGVHFQGWKFLPANLVVFKKIKTEMGKMKCHVRVTVTEGKYHQVKHMFEAFGLFVIKLRRISFGPFQVKGIPIGQWRRVSDKALEALKRDLETA